MHDTLGVRRVQRIGNLSRELDRGVHVERLAPDLLVQSAALQQLHHDEPPAFPFSDVVNRADVRVVQRRGRARLAQMPVDRIGILSSGLGHELQGDVAVEASVLGLPDDAHPALTDLLDQTVVRQLLAGFDRHLAVLPRRFRRAEFTVGREREGAVSRFS